MSKALNGGEIGLIGYWPLNEAFGKVAQDKARFRTAQIFSDWEVLPKGSAMVLDGQNDFLTLNTANTVILSEETDFSIELWFKGGAQANTTLFSSGKGDGTDAFHLGSWQIGFNNHGKLVINAGGNAMALDTDSNDYLTDTWHHLAVSVNRQGNLSIFIDGDLQKKLHGPRSATSFRTQYVVRSKRL